MLKFSLCRMAAAAAVICVFHAHARADSHVCEQVQRDMFVVDGMIDDWSGFRGRKVAGSPDLGLVVRCAYDDQSLYVALNVRDQELVRTRRARVAKEDRIAVELGVGGAPLRFSFLPGTDRAPPKAVGGQRLELADSLQEQGWSLEARVPLSRLAGWGRTVPYLSARLAYHDVDRGEEKAVAAFAGKLHFSQAAANYRAFLRASGLRSSSIRLDVLADVDPGQGAERVIAGGAVIGVLGDGYTFMTLPVRSPDDVLAVKTADLDGSGRSAILAHYRQHGGGGSREVVAVYFPAGDGSFTRGLAFEVAKQVGERRLASEWKLVPRGAHRPKARRTRGHDILVTAGEPVGWSAASYRETPAPDARPILLPWSDDTSVLYYFEGTTAYTEDEPRLPRR